jgi:hypothetical protein
MSSERVGRTYFQGASGTSYEFSVYEPDADIPSAGGVFVVSGVSPGMTPTDERRIWLIGRSPDISRTADQVARHARLEGVERRQICIRVEERNRRARDRIAKDLAAAYRPSVRMGV